MLCPSPYFWVASADAAYCGGISCSGSSRAGGLPLGETSRYDEDPVFAAAVFRRFRRRRRFALSGEAGDPLVLVPDLAGAAGGAGARQQADRGASGPVVAR